MNRRSILLWGAVAVGLLPACVDIPVSPVSGSRQGAPWGDGGYGGYPANGGYGGYPDYDRGYDYEDERAWEREHQRFPCDKVEDRIGYDRGKIAEIGPTGRHKKALQWYQDDLKSAERDQYECRGYLHEKREDAELQRRNHEREAEQRRERQREDCAKLEGRIQTDRAKIAEIGPTGRHRDALQWYKTDLGNAERARDNCRRPF